MGKGKRRSRHELRVDNNTIAWESGCVLHEPLYNLGAGRGDGGGGGGEGGGGGGGSAGIVFESFSGRGGCDGCVRVLRAIAMGGSSTVLYLA